MYRILKKESIRHILPGALTALVLGIVCFCISGFGIFRLLAGPVDLDSLDTSELDGAYVSLDTSRVIASFASVSRNDEVIETYYMVELSDGHFIMLSAGPAYDSIFSMASSQSQEYYLGDLEELEPMGLISGSITTADSELMGYLRDGLDSAGILPEGTTAADASLPYNIQLDKIGWCSVTWVYILTAASILLLLLGLFFLLRALSGAYIAKVRAKIDSDALPEAEADFQAAQRFGNIWVGKHYTWYFRRGKAQVIRTSDILWIFNQLDSRVLGKYRYSLSVYLNDQSNLELRTATAEERTPLAEAIMAQGYPVVYGYSQERAHQYAYDLPAFKAIAKKEAAART